MGSQSQTPSPQSAPLVIPSSAGGAPLGSGMANAAALSIKGRKTTLDDAIKASGG